MHTTQTGNGICVYDIISTCVTQKCRRYMAEILPIRRKTLSNQSTTYCEVST